MNEIIIRETSIRAATHAIPVAVAIPVVGVDLVLHVHVLAHLVIHSRTLIVVRLLLVHEAISHTHVVLEHLHLLLLSVGQFAPITSEDLVPRLSGYLSAPEVPLLR